jgi:hypothetical protein
MNNKIKIKVTLGIILAVAIIMGGVVWFINKKQGWPLTTFKSDQTNIQRNESKIKSCNELSQSDFKRIWDFELRDQNDVDIVNELTFKVSTDAIMYYDEKGTYAGFSLNKKLDIPSCGSDPIIQISPDGQKVAFYGKMCTRKDMFICVDLEENGSPEYGLVCNDYIQLNIAACPKKL